MTLSAEEALKLYQKRWPVEVDNLNLKVKAYLPMDAASG